MKGLRWTTAGESHGRALVATLEGLPAGLSIDVERVHRELARRQGGYGRGGRMKIERDEVELISGVLRGETIGSPLALVIENRDFTIEKLDNPTRPRPGHADLTGCQKLSRRDVRGVMERASARETAARVALGGIARQLLEVFGIEVFAHVVALGGAAADGDPFDRAGEERHTVRDASDFHSLAPELESTFRELVDGAKKEGDTLGGVFEVRALGLPPGLGGFADPRERLTSRLGGALFSIPAIKGCAFGLGFEAAARPGSAVHDAIVPGAPEQGRGRYRRATNRAGGLEGGMTTGEDLVVRVAMKPISTLRAGLPTVDLETGERVVSTYQRSDVCAVPAASCVGEAVVALELASTFLEKFAGDSLDQVRDALEAYRTRLGRI